MTLGGRDLEVQSPERATDYRAIIDKATSTHDTYSQDLQFSPTNGPPPPPTNCWIFPRQNRRLKDCEEHTGKHSLMKEALLESSSRTRPSNSLRREKKDTAHQQHRVARANKCDGARGLAVVEVRAEAHAYKSGASGRKVVDPVSGRVLGSGSRQ
jgi:hypothetical protein